MTNKVINVLGLAVLLFELGDSLRTWARDALRDGQISVDEAGQLAAPIEKALNSAVHPGEGKRIKVTISIEGA